MQKFKYTVLGLLLGWVTTFAIAMAVVLPISLGANPGDGANNAFMNITMWALFAGPMMGLAYTSSKGYFGKVALFIFFACAAINFLAGIITASGFLHKTESGYTFDKVFGYALAGITAAQLVYWYICIGMGECSFIRIYLIPLGIMAAVLGIFALLLLGGDKLAFAATILLPVASIVAIIILYKKNGSILVGRDDY